MNEKQKKEQAERLLQKATTVKLFQRWSVSPDGIEVLKELSKICNENEPTYVDQNSNGTAYREGQRSVILVIRRLINKKFEPRQEKSEL